MPDVGASIAGATAAAPAANTTIIATPDLPDGLYEVEVITLVSAAAPTNNFNVELRSGSTTLATILAVQDRSIMRRILVELTGTNTILLRTGAAAGGAGAVYNGELAYRRVSGTLIT